MVVVPDTSNCCKEESEEETAMAVDVQLSFQTDHEDNLQLSLESVSDENSDLLTAELVDTPVEIAAAVPVASTKKRKKPYSFEVNPSIRKRQKNRLLKKLRLTLDEFTTRVGQQAIVLVANSGKSVPDYSVFGAKPLQNVIKKLGKTIKDELEDALAHHTPPEENDPSLFELPPLIIDGTHLPLEKMTQAQLRAFIPLMLKYSTGRGKPGWGVDRLRPPWWPEVLPWANIRIDSRSHEQKQTVGWTHALRQVVINCYKYHGREDLLPKLPGEDITEPTATTTQNSDSDCDTTIENPNNPLNNLPDDTTTDPQMTTIETAQGKSIPVHIIPVIPENVSQGTISIAWVTEAVINPDGYLFLNGENGSVSVLQVPASHQAILANNSDRDCVNPLNQSQNEANSGENLKILALTQNDLATLSMIQSSDNDAAQMVRVVLTDDSVSNEVNAN